MSTEKTFIVEVAITGRSYVEVVAESEDEAEEKSRTASGWVVEEWDRNTDPSRGGFIHVE